MAQPVEQKIPSIANKHMFPWEQWLDGRTWILKQGEDFHLNPKQMRQAIYKAANKYGVKVQVHINDNKVTIERTH